MTQESLMVIGMTKYIRMSNASITRESTNYRATNTNGKNASPRQKITAGNAIAKSVNNIKPRKRAIVLENISTLNA